MPSEENKPRGSPRQVRVALVAYCETSITRSQFFD